MGHSDSNPGRQVIYSAFEIAGARDESCRPVHVLEALTEYEGPTSIALASLRGRGLFGPPVHRRAAHGGRASFLVMQTQQGARRFASERGETMGPEHLLLVVLDQNDREVLDVLDRAGLDFRDVRGAALEVIGAPRDLPPISLPLLTPAGTMDRPPLVIDDLDPQAWSALCWRHAHLPFEEIKKKEHYAALSRLESRAAGRVASRRRLDDDQRYSLLRHHLDHVEHLAAQAKPELVDRRGVGPVAGATGLTVVRRLRLTGPKWLRFTVGWGTWIGNRREATRRRWFQLRTHRYFRHAPPLAR
jgi:hypothetical protein